MPTLFWTGKQPLPLKFMINMENTIAYIFACEGAEVCLQLLNIQLN